MLPCYSEDFFSALFEAMGGYAVPTSPAGQSCLDGEYFSA